MRSLPREAVAIALIYGYTGVVAAAERVEERGRDVLDDEELHLATRIRGLVDGLIDQHTAALAERRAEITASGVIVARH